MPLSTAQIIALAEKQADVLTAVATTNAKIESFEGNYRTDARTLRTSLARLDIENPFPWSSLWEWHGRYKRDMPTYAERRAFIRAALQPTLEALESLESGKQIVDAGTSGSPTWQNIDARIQGVVAEVTAAKNLDGYQDTARRSREVLIDIAKLIADPALVPAGQYAPKLADGKAWLGLFLDHHLIPGSVSTELRNLVNAAWDLAQRGTHGSTEDVHAFAVAQAVILIARVVQKLRADQDVPALPAVPDLPTIRGQISRPA